MRRSSLFVLCLVFIALFIIIPAAPAQAQAATCPELVQRALTEIGSNCANQERNSACYGFNQVSATFIEAVPSGFFSQPTDLTGLNILDSLLTAPLNEAQGIWGVATMNVQANLPNTLPGQSVVFILLGDIEIENAVAEDEALILSGDVLEVTTRGQAQLRSQPNNNAAVLATVDAGEGLQADGISQNGNWLRVFYIAEHQASAWIAVNAVETEGDLSALPTISPQSRSPMQAFRFQSSVQGVTCEEAPSALVVQGPENIQVDINANGADIRIGSLIMLTTSPDGEFMTITVLSGLAVLNPNTGNPFYLPAGFTATCRIADIVNGRCPWSDGEPFSEEIQEIIDIIRLLFELSPNLFNYLASPPRYVCASSIGSAECEFIFDNPGVDLALAQQMCPTINSPLCALLFP